MLRLLTCLLIVSCCSIQMTAQPVSQPLPAAPPQKAGYPPSFFTRLNKQLADSIPCLGSFIVWKHNAIIYESYFHGATEQTSFDIKSITKSVVSAIAGVASAKNLLPALDKRVMDFFPEYAASRHAPLVWFADEKEKNDNMRNQVTLRDLLTMQPGFEWSDFGPVVNAFINASDPVRFTLELPFADTPGKRFVYCSAAASVFCAALAKSLPMDIKSFAETNLFTPAGMSLQRWDTDAAGRYVGASEMYMIPRDLLRFGLLYLHHGKAGEKQLIPAEWIKASTDKQATLNYWDILPHVNGYGYFWWRRKTNGHQAFIASGAGGQLVAVVPDLDMVVVGTCFLNEGNRGREEIRRLQLFLDKITLIKQ